MFHLQNGLFFERQNDGSVRIIKTYDGREPRADNVVLDEKTTESTWASVVCSVSKDGETSARWERARRFHGTEIPMADVFQAPQVPKSELVAAIEEAIRQMESGLVTLRNVPYFRPAICYVPALERLKATHAAMLNAADFTAKEVDK